MIKYLGSKRLLVPLLLDVAQQLGPAGSALDLFAGTSRVGHALKRAGHRVLANDHNAYAAALATCYIVADAEPYAEPAAALLAELNRLPPRAGYFTETFCVQSRFFHPKNGERIDAIRDRIEALDLEPVMKAVLVTSLMEAADRVDSTTGVQMAYLKRWAPRASNTLELRLPHLLPRAPAGPGEAWQLDALAAVERLQADLCYMDPPYNQHKYVGNYHIWETLTLWDHPPTYGVARKRLDCKARQSVFNSRPSARAAMEHLLRTARARHLILSFNDEGFLHRRDIEAMLAARGPFVVLEQIYPRYVGAQIGIHNPSGEKVGQVSHLKNKEFIYVSSEDPAAIARVRQRFHGR